MSTRWVKANNNKIQHRRRKRNDSTTLQTYQKNGKYKTEEK
jgi:hypothetical protein